MEIKPYERKANYYETDQMGIVHHSNYIRYFEEARMDFMRQLGLSTRVMEEDGIIIPNVDAYARYLHLLRFEDQFIITVKPAVFTGVKIRFEYEVIKDGKVCCTGHTTHCFVDTTMKPIMLRHSHPELFERFKEIFGGITRG